MGVQLLVRLRIELRGRIVRQAADVDDRAAAIEVRLVDVPHVVHDELDAIHERIERLAAEEQAIEDLDRVALLEQCVNQDAAHVPSATDDEDLRHSHSFGEPCTIVRVIRDWSDDTG